MYYGEDSKGAGSLGSVEGLRIQGWIPARSSESKVGLQRGVQRRAGAEAGAGAGTGAGAGGGAAGWGWGSGWAGAGAGARALGLGDDFGLPLGPLG